MKKYEEIYRTYKDLILSGILKEGDCIDSIRVCCKKRNVSKTTVENAYQKLMLDGFISSKEKVGYVVCMKPEQIQLHHEILEYSNEHKEKVYRYDLRIQSVSFDSFEINIWKRYMKQVLNDKACMSSYGQSQGEYALRRALCKYVYENRNILCFPKQMVIGSNYQSLLYIFCGILDKAKRVGVSPFVDEEARQVFVSYGFSIVDCSTENFVQDIQEKHVDIVYVNTTCFTKDKQAMPAKVREELLKIKGILILEDDYNGELVYASKPKPCLFSKSRNVIYFSSFSRLLLPSLRMSYMILNEEFVEQYQSKAFGPTASKMEQLALSQYIVDGYLQKHLRKLIREYKEKSQLLQSLLKEYVDYPFYLDEAHMAYWIVCDKNREDLLNKSESYSLRFNIESNCIGLSFASIEKEKMRQAVICLAQLLKEC